MAEEEITVNRLTSSKNASGRSNQLKLYICPTTGGTVRLIVPAKETVHGLKTAISRKIRIPPERINLLFKNNILKDGTLYENHVTSESRITLLPNMASGLTFQRPDSSVMQALENLSESQVNDFLSGRAPLLLAMRLGDHMMFVQLQLSTSQCVNNRRSRANNVPKMSTSSSPSHTVFPQTTPVSPASLAEASRSLSQKLRELTRLTGHTKVGESAQVTVSSRVPPPSTPVCPQHAASTISNQGAVIDSMHHLGQGVYSGTFSGTLDPNLQDIEGKPRKDIGTIVHILNDLLGASPHYHSCRPFLLQRQGAMHHRINSESSEPQQYVNPEESVLRGKVRQLQMMMEQRRLRRKARREMKAPYQWTSSRSCSEKSSSAYCHQASSVNTRESVSGASSGITDNNQMEIQDNRDSSTYRNPNMEQETVAV